MLDFLSARFDGFLAMLARDDVKTVLTLLTTIIAVYMFLRRVREEGRKARIARLETRSLDELFRFREQLVRSLDRFEELPDVTDTTTARAFGSTMRAIRHDLRRSIDEHALLANADEYERHARAFDEADESYRALVDGFADGRIDYNLANRFKRILYQLLWTADTRIVEIQELDGRSRAREKILIRSKYEERVSEIDDLLGQPSGWMPVHGNESVTSSRPTVST